MSIYVYDGRRADNYDTIGLVGRLEPTSCVFTDEPAGESAITMIHPYDQHGKWRALVNGNIIKVEVPVMTVPEISNGQIVTTVETWTVKATATKPQRYVYSRKSGGSKRKLLAAGTKVTVTNKYPEETSSRYKVKTGKVTGYMDVAALEYETTHVLDDNVDNLETIVPTWETREQLFRICDRKPTDTSVTVYARHISYDLLGVVTYASGTGSYDLQTVINYVLEHTSRPHEFTAQTNIGDKRTGINYAHINPIEAFLDPEKGVVALWDCQMVRDNTEFSFLRGLGKDRGFRVEYGKNMTGVNCDISEEDAITRVLPTGVNKDGKPLYLTDNDWTDASNWVSADNVSDYATPHDAHLPCDDCTVGENDVTVSVARARMREQAEKLLESGVNLSVVSMDVTFVNLGDTVEYSAYKKLVNAYLYDKVYANIPHAGLSAMLDVVKVEWDCILQRFNKMYLGALDGIEGTIQGYQLAGGISGNKLLAGSIGSAALGSGIIAAWHLQANSITTDKLAANSITADKIAANAIEADKLAANSITADKIDAGAITADKIKAGAITANEIASAAITAEKIASKTITADQIAGKIITAESGLIKDGAIGTAQIADGSITSAKVVELNADVITAGTISAERLMLVGEDGVIHKLNASSLGVTTSELTKDEYKKQLDGSIVVARSLTGEHIAAESITSNEILAGSITADRIDVHEFFAADATVDELKTMDISSNTYLKLAVADARSGDRNLLKKSDVAVAPTNAYTIADYYFGDEIPAKNEVYTVRIWGDAGVSSDGSDLPFVVQSRSVGTEQLSAFGKATKHADGTYVYTGKWPVDNPEYLTVKTSVFAASRPYAEITRIKLEKGDTPTDWSPHREEFKSGSSIKLDEDEVRISTPEFNIDIVSADGETNMLTIDDTGAQMASLSAPNVAVRYDGAKDIIVRGGLTEDEYASGMYARSLAEVISRLNGRILDDDITIGIWPGVDNYQYGDIRLVGVCGMGSLKIVTAMSRVNASIVGGITVSHCTIPIELEALDVFGDEFGLRVARSEIKTTSCVFKRMNNQKETKGIVVERGGVVTDRLSKVYGFDFAYWATEGGVISSQQGAVDANVNALCGTIYLYNITYQSTEPWAPIVLAGVVHEFATQTGGTESGPTAPSLPTTVTAAATETKSYSSDGWRSDNEIRQGKYQKNNYAGCIWFETLPNKTLKDATLTLKRVNNTGRGSEVRLHLYAITATSTGNPTSGYKDCGVIGSINGGETRAFSILEAAQLLATGGYKGLALFDPDAELMPGRDYSANYCRIESGSPILTVTY